ncbi:MAG: uroporphyrinogen-III synthase [Betaproteobacteria bacterium]|nr:uroporphyrinogen-III synthase [Betaproteobacteria bacterium]
MRFWPNWKRAAEVAQSGGGQENSSNLAGRGIVITRPRDQAHGLIALVKAAGGRPIAFPALEIVDALDSRALRALVDRLESFDLAIFVSPTAASRGLNLVRRRRELPPGLQLAAVGKGSARELQRLGAANVLVPESGADSEALLALPQLADLRGRSVLIFRGVGGRELLGDTLVRHGARVEYAECYRRTRPQADVQMLLRAWTQGEIHAVTVTSSEGLSNLFDMLGTLGRHWLRKTALFVPHERIAARARDLGIADVVVADPGDEAMVGAIARYLGLGS